MKKSQIFLLILLCGWVSLSAETPSSVPLQAVESPPFPVVQPEKELEPQFLEELRKGEKQGDDRFVKEFMKMLLVLAIIVGLIFFISWFLKKMMQTRIEQMNGVNMIKVLERRGLSQKSSLYLIKVGGKGILIADSLNGVTHLTDVDLPTEQQGAQA